MIIFETSSSFTRPADTSQYAQNDLVANSTTAGSVVPLVWKVPLNGAKLWRVNLSKSSTTVTNASFRLHLYKDSPTAANGDNGAWSTTVSGYLGFIDIVGTSPAFTDSATASGVWINNSVFAPFMLLADKDRKIYGLLQNTTATGYVPTSGEVFTVSLIGESYA